MKKILIMGIYFLFPLTGNTALPSNYPFQHKVQDQTKATVSMGVILKDEKPFCYFSALENRKAVPEQFALSKNDIQLDLPECSQEEMNKAQYAVQNSITEETKLAAGPFAFLVPFCILSIPLGGVLALAYIDADYNGSKKRTILTSLLTTALLSIGLVATARTSLLTLPSILLVGTCASTAATIVFLGKELLYPEEMTPSPMEEMTPSPMEEMTYSPMEEMTPSPMEEMTPSPMEEMTPSPMEEMTPSPMEELTYSPMEELTYSP